MSEEQVQPQLALERIYTKDISFEVPGAQVFTKQWHQVFSWLIMLKKTVFHIS